MELGALICTPRVYSCDKCPLSSLCTAKKYGVQAKFPVLPEKKEKRTDEVWTFVIRTPNGFSVRKRESGVLKGMNEFPSFPRQTPARTKNNRPKNAKKWRNG